MEVCVCVWGGYHMTNILHLYATIEQYMCVCVCVCFVSVLLSVCLSAALSVRPSVCRYIPVVVVDSSTSHSGTPIDSAKRDHFL